MKPLIPADDKARKGLPLLKQYTHYFPRAMREITKVSVVNNVRYNPDRAPADINWARGKSTDQLGSGFRHIVEHEVDGKIFDVVPDEIAKATGIDRIYILAQCAWRIQAALELEIEAQEKMDEDWAAANQKLPDPLVHQVELEPGVYCACAECAARSRAMASAIRASKGY
jgi:hypothetical protein